MKSPTKVAASRRAVLGAPAVLFAASAAGAATPGSNAEAQSILERYHAFGDKAAGGPGDAASGEWLEGELTGLGFTCQRQTYDVPAFEGDATLTSSAARADLIPQAIVVPTSDAGLSGPLYVAGAGRGGAGIALLILPYARWSTAVGQVSRRVQAVLDGGASAVIIVTTGPTGEALALNAPVDKPLFDKPVAVMAPQGRRTFPAGGNSRRCRNPAGRRPIPPSARVQCHGDPRCRCGQDAGDLDAPLRLVRLRGRTWFGHGRLADAGPLGGPGQLAGQHRPGGHQRPRVR